MLYYVREIVSNSSEFIISTEMTDIDEVDIPKESDEMLPFLKVTVNHFCHINKIWML